MSNLDDNSPIRILHVIGIMNRAGAEAMIMNLYRNINRERVQFDFVENSLKPAAYDNEIEELGGRIFRCPHYTGKNHNEYVSWWKSFFKRYAQEYRIIHGHIGSTASIYLGIAKRFGLYTIAHSHNTHGGISLQEIMYRVYSYRTRYIADFFFACSLQAGIDRFGIRTTRKTERFKVLNNAIDTDEFAFNPLARTRVRSNLGLSDELIVGHVGRFVDQKNHDYLIDVFWELSKLNSQVRLLLVGDGPLRTQIEKKVRALNIENKVIFTGVRDDVSDLMQAMDVFVFPSKKEGLGVVLIEAQTSGLPCVISDRIPEEAIISERLMDIMSLKASPGDWAERILLKKQKKRLDNTEEVRSAGYDIRETARWLEDFYCERSEQGY